MTHDPLHWMLAALATAAWLALLAWTAASALRRRRKPQGEGEGEAAGEPGDILVAFASQTGMAEDLAAMTAQAAKEAGRVVRVASFADLDLAGLQASRRALFVVATTGEGDAPDSATRVVRRLMSRPAELPGLSYGLLALGDRSYKDFCGFGRAVDDWLRRSGATPLFDAIEVDDADPDAIRHWRHQLNAMIGVGATADWTTPVYQPWRLVERRLANPGSPGGEAWHVALEPASGAVLPRWSAGDIVEIGVPAADGASAAAAREYSIASLPEDGRIALLVRLMRHEDGRPGLASGWLTRDAPLGAALGADVGVRIRTNSAFHAPEPTRPLILIGAGTGIAGLRAHLKARTADSETWLMFGERTRAHDAYYDDDLQAWLHEGRLTRLDRAFSREAPSADFGDGRYVQALIDHHAAEVRSWVRRGAAIYVCGSLEGMASGVHAALQTALGVDGLADLAEGGRYRRDVY